MTEFFVYELPPIDWWGGSVPVAEYLLRGLKKENDQLDDNVIDQTLQHIAAALYAIAQKSSWEGDMTLFRVAGIPAAGDDPSLQLLVMIKQSNNGTTFVASPFALSHLAAYETRKR